MSFGYGRKRATESKHHPECSRSNVDYLAKQEEEKIVWQCRPINGHHRGFTGLRGFVKLRKTRDADEQTMESTNQAV